jgi:anti-sigma factor RsiW
MTDRDCSVVGELIPQFLSGRLSADEEETVRAHIATCAECRQRANAVSLLQQTPVPVPDQDRWDHFVDEIVEATQTEGGAGARRRAGRWLVALAAAAVVVLSWVRVCGRGDAGPSDIESIAREVADLPNAEVAAWTTGLSFSGFIAPGFGASDLTEPEFQQLVAEVGRS